MISREFVKESRANHIYSWEGLREECKEMLASSSEEGKKFRLTFLKALYNKNKDNSKNFGLRVQDAKILVPLMQKVGEMSGSINPQAFDDREDELLKKKLPTYIDQYLKRQVAANTIVNVGNDLWSTRGKQDIDQTCFSARGLIDKYKQEILEDNAKALTYFFAMCRRQTDEEVVHGVTITKNSLGFNKPDAPFMTKLYLDAVNGNRLPSSEDRSEMQSRLVKYARQLMEIMIAEGVIEEVEKGIYRRKV